MEVIGKVHVINPEQQVSASFKKRELVVETDEQYKQLILIEFTQDKCDLLNAYQVGQDVKVSINLRGREWVNSRGETRYLNQIQGWKIERIAVAPTPAADAYQAKQPALPDNTAAMNEEEASDLPF